MKPPRSPLTAHLEAHLGKIRRGWPFELDAGKLFVVEFADRPAKGVRTWATLGLSEALLSQANGPALRQELLFCGRDLDENDVGNLLAVVADETRARGRSLDRGEVLGPSGPILASSTCEALYCAAPVYYPESLAMIDEVGGAPLVMVWLVPITRAEAQFIAEHDWQAFEALLEAQDPDLTDVRRPSLTLLER